MDEAGLAVVLELVAQLAQVNVERIRRPAEVVSPDALGDEGAWKDLARVEQKQLQQEELHSRELDPARTALHLEGSAVEREIGKAEDRVCDVGGRAPDERVQARDQLLERERFDEVVVGAGLEPGDAIRDR